MRLPVLDAKNQELELGDVVQAEGYGFWAVITRMRVQEIGVALRGEEKPWSKAKLWSKARKYAPVVEVRNSPVDGRGLFALKDLKFGDRVHVPRFRRGFNHSCYPNAIAILDKPASRMAVYALRYIPKGDEVFLSYGSKRHFECRCPICR